MAREVRKYTVTIPAGTTATAPHKVRLTMPPLIVTAIRWMVPPGWTGYAGFAIGNAQTSVIPYNGDKWIVATDDSDVLTLTDYTTSGTWWLIGYDTGTHPHTVYLTFECTLPSTASPLAPSVAPTMTSTPTPAPVVTGGTTPVTYLTGASTPGTPATVPPLPTLPTAPTAGTPSLPAATLPAAPTLATPSLPPAPTVGA